MSLPIKNHIFYRDIKQIHSYKYIKNVDSSTNKTQIDNITFLL